jgi:5'-AMP-activated protein kinase, regulatory gamma subunit
MLELTEEGIVSAPLWDSSTSTYAGLLTVNDYLNVVRYYNLHADKLKDVDSLLLSDLRGTLTARKFSAS